MKPVKKTKNLPTHAQRLQRRAERKSLETAIKGKSFVDLTPSEKDDLLKLLALNAGLVSD